MRFGPRRQTVLVIDDDAIVRLMTTESMGEAGYEVIAVASAEEGCAHFDREGADLVLLDVILPGMNGFEACARLRAHAAGAHVPILMMTGLGDRKSIVEAFESGATDFVTKPIVWDLLPYRVGYALRACAALREAQRGRALLSRSQMLANMGSWEWRRADDSVAWSDEMHTIQGTAPTPLPLPLPAASLLAQVHPDDRAVVERAFDRARLHGEAYGIEFRIVRPDGAVRRLFEQIEVERDAGAAVSAVHGIRRDITQQTEANERIRTLAFFDPLTGLANHALLRTMMSQWLPRAAQAGMRCALLMIDIDRFKWVNEALGPRIDDEMLKAVAQRLRNCLRGADGSGPGRGPSADDRIARLGGDEFAVLLVDIGEPAQAHQVAQRIVATLSQPVIVQGHELTVCPSVGMAMTPDDGDDMTTLLRNASTAMHAAKQDDRNPIRFYDSAMSAEIVRRHTIETELRHAVEHGELRVHYQPKVDLRSLSVVGAEALLRWAHPVRGLIGAIEFIPIAQESGLIVPITRWVIRQVCDQLAAWQAQGVDSGPVSINLDATSLEGGDLVAHVNSVIAHAGLLPGMIEFEVTESTLMRNLERVGRTLEALRAIGVKLSIDDFGTGYSSLAYLKRLPVDVLKIDRMFIKDSATEASDAALVTAIIAMGRSLKLQFVAEGVETWAQADFLARSGCHLVQGFLFARALPAEGFAALVRAGLPARELERSAA